MSVFNHPKPRGSLVPRSTALAAAAAGLLAIGPSAAQPSANVSDWAAPQLREMDAVFGRPVEGLTFEGMAPAGETGAVRLKVPAAGRYAVVGACGEDCADIGLILDKDGKPVAQGVTGFKSTLAPGDYDLKVAFDACKTERCRYVVRVYPAG
jgi:hypothetical protein